VARALHARIQLRCRLKREPSVAEVRERLRDVEECRIPWRQLVAAFEKGEEVRQGQYPFLLDAGNSDILQKMRAVGIQCKRYDSNLAAIISES
jgi:hypothetical protein